MQRGWYAWGTWPLLAAQVCQIKRYIGPHDAIRRDQINSIFIFAAGCMYRIPFDIKFFGLAEGIRHV